MDNTNSKTKPKLKPAKSIGKRLQDAKEKMIDISSSVGSTQNGALPLNEPSEQEVDADVIVPACQPGSESVDVPEGAQVEDKFSDMLLGSLSVHEFCTFFETALNTMLDNRNIAQEKANREMIEKAKAQGEKAYTVEEVLSQCTMYMEAIVKSYNLYATHKSAIDKRQSEIGETQKGLKEVCNGLSTIIGRIEDVQGVKAPRRPPFPSWACLAYLFWHWPMYGFARCWQSKYFRRFCFLIAFFVMVLEFCLIVVLACDNKILNHDRAKYVTVRNWSYVMNDTSAVNRFDYVDLLFEDVKFNREKLDKLDEYIRTKYEMNQRSRK